MTTNAAMTTSNKLWLGLGTTLVLLGLCGLTLLVRWPSVESLNASRETILRDIRFSFGITLFLLLSAGAIAVATCMAISRSLVASLEPLSDTDRKK